MIEGDERERSLLAQALLHFGFPVRSVATAGEAANLLRGSHRCIIIDLALPDQAGVALLREVRAIRPGPKVAVTLPQQVDPDLNVKVKSWAPDACFRKPVNALEVVAWVRTLTPPAPSDAGLSSNVFRLKSERGVGQ